MKALINSLRVFKRLRVLEQFFVELQLQQAKIFMKHSDRLSDIEKFIVSREPCSTCGHHRYKQKTLHYDACTRNRRNA